MFDPRNLAPEIFARGARAFDVPEESIRRLIAAVVGRGILDPIALGTRLSNPAPPSRSNSHPRCRG